MKSISYIANVRIPTEKAHGIQIMKMCEAFSNQSANVELIIPKRKNHLNEDPFEYYCVDRNFRISKGWCLDFVKLGYVGYWIELITFTLPLVLKALFKNVTFYTRDEFVAFCLKFIGKEVVWEAHRGQVNLFIKSLLKLNIKIVVISAALKSLYVTLGAKGENILVSPDGVDIDQFNTLINKEEARFRCGLDQHEKTVLYTGHLYSWKGADILAEAAKNIPEVSFIFVGGTEKDITSFRSRFGDITNIKIVGRKPYKDIPTYMRCADILALPNSAKEDISKYYTSPLKLFEYMASGKPIIASDLPSIHEIIDESTSYFFEPDNVDSLVITINQMFKEYHQAEEKAKNNLSRVWRYSWDNRANEIVQFVN